MEEEVVEIVEKLERLSNEIRSVYIQNMKTLNSKIGLFEHYLEQFSEYMLRREEAKILAEGYQKIETITKDGMHVAKIFKKTENQSLQIRIRILEKTVTYKKYYILKSIEEVLKKIPNYQTRVIVKVKKDGEYVQLKESTENVMSISDMLITLMQASPEEENLIKEIIKALENNFEIVCFEKLTREQARAIADLFDIDDPLKEMSASLQGIKEGITALKFIIENSLENILRNAKKAEEEIRTESMVEKFKKDEKT
ncbi:MAG: hypothetical protein ACP5IZ_09850 [Thermoprotei archaeon]